ncbi:MAG: aminoacyl-tRNA hydrolase [Oscillospiraceae bacterium]|jgi:PTH1 family peptidyl-tRNA hydrolase|nr:aminoacyl-tRNA hydrolase [Oscillospiraceae bacterium]
MFNKFKKFNNSTAVDYIIVGLGNPGTKYDNTRHNIGFFVLDTLADKLKIKINRVKFKSNSITTDLGGHKVLLLKPSTFMNLSGQAVVEAMQFYKLPPQNVLIIFDDISLPTGRLRIRQKGSDGGQKGMQNIIYLNGSDEFPRIRIGIGQKPHPDYDLSAWVLSKFSQKEQQELAVAAQNAIAAIELIINGDIDKAMNLYNQK